MNMENLNEVLPKYKLMKNGDVVMVSASKRVITSGYNYECDCAEANDQIRVLEDDCVIESFFAGGDE